MAALRLVLVLVAVVTLVHQASGQRRIVSFTGEYFHTVKSLGLPYTDAFFMQSVAFRQGM